MNEDLLSDDFEKESLKKIVNKNILLVKIILIVGGLIQGFYSISSLFEILNPIPGETSIYIRIEPYLGLIFIFLYFYSWITYLKGLRMMKNYADDFSLSILIKSNLLFGKALIITLIANSLTLINIILKTPFY